MHEFRILGPLEVAVDRERATLGGAKQRALLATLLLSPGRAISTDELVDSIWGERPPESARHLVQVYVSQLRTVLGEGSGLATRAPGYELRVSPEALDALRFRSLLERAAASSAEDERIAFLDEGLALWRGRTLADVLLEDPAAVAVRELDDLHLTAVEDRAQAALALGRHGEVLADLERLATEEPLRERLQEYRLVALYQSGRQADALAAYRALRQRYADELGIEPGPRLRELERRILNQDPSLDPPPLSRPLTRKRWPPAAAAALVLLAAAVATAFLVHHGSAGTVRLKAGELAVVDIHTGRVADSVELGSSLGAVAAAGDNVWVANTRERTIAEVNAKTLHVDNRIGVAVFPYRIAVVGHHVWVANGYDGSVTVVDPINGIVSHDLRPDPDATGRISFATTAGTLWIGSQDGVVTRVDPTDGRTLSTARIPLPQAAVAGFGAVWLADATRAAVARVAVDGKRAPADVPLGSVPAAIATGAGAVWVVTPTDGRLWRIDPRTNAVTNIVEVGSGAALVTATHDSVWVARSAPDQLVRIDPRTLHVTRRVNLSGPISGLAIGGRGLWVALR